MTEVHVDQETFAKEISVLAPNNTIRIYWRGTPKYNDAIKHRFPNGIKEVTFCVLEPGDEIDLRGLMQLVAARKIRFGIKNGGHISIPKIRPPYQGVIISLERFKNISYNKEKKTLDVGAGVIWKEVYDHFKKVSGDQAPGVVGGDPNVGVSGWLLGGGYSLLTNRFGLGIDNIISIRVISPKGISQSSRDQDPELFMALKGGAHNFGIVTGFTLQVHDHAKRVSAIVDTEFPESMSGFVKNAMVSFIQDDSLPRSAVAVAAFRHDLKDGNLKSIIPMSMWLTETLPEFIHTSMPLGEAYEAFSLRHLPVSKTALKEDFNSVDEDSMPQIEGGVLDVDLIERGLFKQGHQIDRDSLMVFTAGGKTVAMLRPHDLRGRMAGISVTTYTRGLIDEAEKQAKHLSSFMRSNAGIRVSFEIWPFHKKAFDGVKRDDSAWPHEEGNVFGPLVGWFEWTGKNNDKFWLEKIANALEELHKVAVKEGCTTGKLPKYLNITLENTSVEEIYRDHYTKLAILRGMFDPGNMMGLAEGFVIPALNLPVEEGN